MLLLAAGCCSVGAGRFSVLRHPSFAPRGPPNHPPFLPAPVPPFLLSTPQEEDPEKYVTHFASYVKAGLDSEELEDLYTKVRRPGGRAGR